MATISRRSVLKGIAAAMMAPTIQLRPSVPDERLLLPFCDPDSCRYSFEAPFGHGSLTYATDARAMIRCELANRQEVGERRLPRDIDNVWGRWFQPASQWRPLTPDDIQPTVEDDCAKCFTCGDRRVRLGGNYPDIDDRGLIVDARLRMLDYDIDDNSVRDDSCPACRGLSRGHKNIAVLFGEEHQAHELKRILALPNVMVCTSEFSPEGHAPALLFRADGFEGIALGLVPREFRV